MESCYPLLAWAARVPPCDAVSDMSWTHSIRYRGLDKPTDILSFGTCTGDELAASDMGDLVVGVEELTRWAATHAGTGENATLQGAHGYREPREQGRLHHCGSVYRRASAQ